MESIGSDAVDLDLGNRVITIVIFLLFFWAIVNWLAINIKNGRIKVPNFLKKNFPQLNVSQEQDAVHKLEIIQRTNLNDGNELLVARVNDKDILLSRNLHSGIRYLKDLDES